MTLDCIDYGTIPGPKIKGPVCNQLSKLKPFVKFLSLKERRELIYSKALLIAKYGLEFYFGQTQAIKDSISAVLMKDKKAIYGAPLAFDTFKNCHMLYILSYTLLILYTHYGLLRPIFG